MAEFLSGFVCITGVPNVGKSTLLNALVGQKIAITSPKPQTTRNRIQGVLTRKDMQIVFIDTPGVNKPKNRLGEYMVKLAHDALDEVECILYVVDGTMGIKEQDEALIERLRQAKAPIIAAINKIDAASMAAVDAITARLGKEKLHDLVKISASTGDGLEALIGKLRALLVPGPMYYPEDMVTDQPERVICAEMIREKALILLQQEIPHGIGVEIEKMQVREDGITDVWAVIYCERDSHKGIVIGKRGAMLKRIGTEGRRDMEWLLGTRVNLQLWVKVKENWRNSANEMRMLGYE